MQSGSYLRLPLHRRDGSIRGYALVDVADESLVGRYRWSVGSHGYASTNAGGGQWVLMHRLIAGLVCGDRREVDHINGDKLDNRRANLRIATRQQNCQNIAKIRGSLSRHRGVSWHKGAGKWQAQVQVNKKRYPLGLFEDELEAAAAADLFRLLYVPFAVQGRSISST